VPNSIRTLIAPLVATVGITAASTTAFAGSDFDEDFPNLPPHRMPDDSVTGNLSSELFPEGMQLLECECQEWMEPPLPHQRPDSEPSEPEISEEIKPLIRGARISSFQSVSFNDDSDVSAVTFKLLVDDIDCRVLRQGWQDYRPQLEEKADNPDALQMLDAVTGELFINGKAEIGFVFNKQVFGNQPGIIFPPDMVQALEEAYTKIKSLGVPVADFSFQASCAPNTFGIQL